jgi:hypothetical protein
MNATQRSYAGGGEDRPAALPENPGSELLLSGSGLAAIMASVLEKGAAFRFTAKGGSMWPFIRDRDILTISKVPGGGIRVGDVLAVANPATGSVIVHRVVATPAAGFMLKGDNCSTADGVFALSCVLGMVTTIERGQRRLPYCSRPIGTVIAYLSASGLLNRLILPLLIKLHQTFWRRQKPDL